MRFTSLGIQNIVAFANLPFRRKKRRSREGDDVLFTHCNDSDWTFATISSEKDVYPIVEKEQEPETVEEGLYIRFASHVSRHQSRPLTESRLARLKYRIAKAVVAAGMESSSPAMETSQPFDNAIKALPPVPASSFYSGTYGQVMEAFVSAGLEAVPCDKSGFDGGEYLCHLRVIGQGQTLLQPRVWEPCLFQDIRLRERSN